MRYWQSTVYAGISLGGMTDIGSSQRLHIRSNITNASPLSELVDKEERWTLQQAAASLSETQRRRLLLYYVQRLTYNQIGQLEGCHYQSVQESISSALDKLKKYF